MRTLFSPNILINMLGFNMIWALCILIGNAAIPVVSALLCLHLWFHPTPYSEARVVCIAAAVGYSIDFTLSLIGFYRFYDIQGVTPYWLIFLWLGFCCTLRQSLAFFSTKLPLAIALGGISGCTSYLTAARLGAVDFWLPTWQTGLILVAIWSMLFPSLLWISIRFGERPCLER